MPQLFNLAPSAIAAFPFHPRLQTSYPILPILFFSLYSFTAASCSWLPFYASFFLCSLTLSGFFNGMLEVFEPGVVNCYIFFRPTTLSPGIHCLQESNLYSSFSFRIPGFSTLRSDRTHSRSGILSRDATHASDGVIIFVRQWLFFSELSISSLSLRLISTLIM